MNQSEIKLGHEYKDVISGFTGIAIAKTEWINGCVRVTLSPKLDKDGKFQDSVCLDIEQLEATGVSVDIKPKEVGGEHDVPKREPVVRAVG
jgi:hypothetical protein